MSRPPHRRPIHLAVQFELTLVQEPWKLVGEETEDGQRVERERRERESQEAERRDEIQRRQVTML